MQFDKINKNSLTNALDPDILQAHHRMHQNFANAIKNDNLDLKKEVEELHPLIVKEMLERGMNHNQSDDLDEHLPTELKESEDYPGSQYIPEERRQIIKDFYDKLPDETLIQPDWLSITGSYLYARGGREPQDLDIVLRQLSEEDIIGRGTTLKLQRMFTKLSGIRAQVLYDPTGCTWAFSPAYDLIMRKRPLEIKSPDSQEFMDRFYEARPLRSASAETEAQAKASEKEDKLEPGRFFYPAKPQRLPASQPQTMEDFINWQKDYLPAYLSRKADGNTLIFTQLNGKVEVFSDDGANVTEKVPRLVKAFHSLTDKDFILIGETEFWEGSQHYPREMAHAAIQKGQDEKLIISLFDKLYWQDVEENDLHKLSASKRFELLQGLSSKPGVQSTSGQPNANDIINILPERLVTTEAELRKVTEELYKEPGAEGVVATEKDSIYPLDGGSKISTNGRRKIHKTLELTAIILDKSTIKNGAYTYNYGVKIDDGINVPKPRIKDDYIIIGKTFSSSHSASISELLHVELETLNLTGLKSGEIILGGYLPIVLGAGKGPIDSIKSVIASAKKAGMLQVKQEIEGGPLKYFPSNEGAEEVLSRKLQESSEGHEDSIMICLIPSPEIANELAIANGEAQEDLHITLAYFGKVKDWSEDIVQELPNLLGYYAAHSQTIKGIVNGVGKFGATESSNGQDVVVALIDLPTLPAWREELLRFLEEQGLESKKNHGFTCHAILEYREPGDSSPLPDIPIKKISFDSVYCKIGEHTYQFPLGNPFMQGEGPKEEDEAWFPIQKAVDPFLNYGPNPNEPKKFVLQQHWRGKSVHGDLRIMISSDKGIGWTIAIANPDIVKEPVETFEQAKEQSKNKDLWKINWETGKFKERETRAGNIQRAQLRIFTKASQVPKQWMTIEGATEKTEPGEVPPVGASRNFPGVFFIADKGEVTLGFQEAQAHEYFMNGDHIKGRLLARLLSRDSLQEALEEEIVLDIQEAEILPPGKQEESPRSQTFWTLIQPKDQTAYVLSDDAVKKGKLPPKGIAALPPEVFRSVPERLKYWLMNGAKALKARNELAQYEELSADERKVKKQKEVSGEFALIRKWFRGQIVIRFGPSSQSWMLILKNNDKIDTFLAERDPLDNDQVAAIKDTTKSSAIENIFNLKEETEIKPGESALNVTKNTPGFLTPEDHGSMQILESGLDFWKIKFSGEHLKGLYIIHRDPGEAIWTMEKSVSGPKITESIWFQETEEETIITGVVLVPNIEDSQGDTFTSEQILKAKNKFDQNPALDIDHKIENNRLSIYDSFLAPENYTLDGTPIEPGSWVLSISTSDPTIIKQVRNYILQGLSIEGFAMISKEQ